VLVVAYKLLIVHTQAGTSASAAAAHSWDTGLPQWAGVGPAGLPHRGVFWEWHCHVCSGRLAWTSARAGGDTVLEGGRTAFHSMCCLRPQSNEILTGRPPSSPGGWQYSSSLLCCACTPRQFLWRCHLHPLPRPFLRYVRARCVWVTFFLH